MSRNVKNHARAVERRAHSTLRQARRGSRYTMPANKRGPSDAVMMQAESRVNASLDYAKKHKPAKRRRVTFHPHPDFLALRMQTREVRQVPPELKLRYEPIYRTVLRWYEHRPKEVNQ